MSFRRGLARFGVCSAATVLVASLFSSSAMAGQTQGPAQSLTENSADTYLPPPTGVLTFTGHGWGHGIGMSQWGAYGAAQQGLSATQILDFYYPGTTRLDIDPKTPIRMLLGTDNGIDLIVSTVAADGALTFTDMATGIATPLPATVAGAPVTGWRLAWANGVIQLQANWTGTFSPYPVAAPLTTTGVARFTSSSGIVRLMNPNGTQDDLYGSVEGVVIGGKLRTVETAGLDDILPAVLGKEMAANWPAAALQAQAVAARSYADFQIGAHVSQPYDVSIPTDFAYEGIARYDSSGNKVASWNDPSLVSAVTAFPGDVRSYGGRAIFAQFSSSNGGYTVAGTVSGSPVPYLVAKADPYDAVAANSHNSWTANVPVSTVTAAYPTVGSLVSITVNSRDGNGQWGGRTLSITVNGSNGSVTDGATNFYQKLGLQSNWWNLPGSADPLGALEAVQTAPGGAQVTGWAFDPKTTAAIAVHLYVDGKMTTAVTANVNRPDLASQLTSGTAHGFSASLKLTPGAHSVCAFAINSQAGGKNPQLGCSNVTAYAGNPIGAVSISSGIGGVAVSGWTLDPDSLAPVTVRFTVDGKVSLVIPASGLDPSLAATFSYYGQNRGFSWLLGLSGTHTVCAIAANVGAGGDTSLGCAKVTVYAGAPIGHLDAAVVPSPGVVALWGWAIDPDTTAQIPVHLYVDGQLVAGVGANQPRPDVQAVYPVYGGSHGYSMLLPLSTGKHTVCAWALNVAGGGGNPELGCQTVTVPSGDPIGHLDGAAYAGQIVTWGWAADPKTPSAPILVHLYVDGKLATLGPANLPRPDVATVYPAFGATHGFYVGIPAASGSHQVCAFAINSRAGANNPELGCGTVKVP